MSEDQGQTEVTEVESQTQPDPTLEDVYKEAGVVEAQPEPRAQPQAPVQPAAPAAPAHEPSSVPDPYTEDFKAYIARQAAGTTALQQTVAQLIGHLSRRDAESARAALQADIGKAVEAVNEIVGYPKPKVIEALLDAKAREDVRFKQLWDGRAKHPTAWANALKAVAKEFAGELSVKVDPSLVAAQRARRESQRQMATTSSEDKNSWDGLNQEDFDRRFQALLSGEGG